MLAAASKSSGLVLKTMKMSKHNLAFYITFAIGLLTQIFMVRNLELADYGRYALLLSVIAFCQFTIQATSQEIYLREMKFSEDIKASETRWYLNSEIHLILIAALFTFIYLSLFVGNIGLSECFLSSLCVMANYGIGKRKTRFLAHQMVPRLNYLELLFATVKLSITVVVMSLTTQLNALIAILLVSIIMQNIIFEFGFARTGREHKPVEQDKNAKKRSTFFVLSRSSLQQGINEADIILLSHILSPKDLAIFRVAKTLSQFMVVAIAPFWREYQPIFIKSDNAKNYFLTIVKCHRISLGFLLFGLLFVLAFSDTIVFWIYALDFSAAVKLLLFLTITKYLFFTTNSWYQLWCVNCSMQAVTLIPAIVSLSIMILSITFLGIQSLTMVGVILLIVYLAYFLAAHIIWGILRS